MIWRYIEVVKLLHLWLWSSYWISVSSTNIRALGYSHQRWGAKNRPFCNPDTDLDTAETHRGGWVQRARDHLSWWCRAWLRAAGRQIFGGKWGNKTMHFSATSSDLFIFGSSFFFKLVYVFPQWLVIYFQVWLQVELYWNFVRILAHQLPRTLTKVTPSQTLHPVVHCCWGKYLNLSWTSPADVCIRAELQRWITSLFSWPIESSWIERSQKSSLCTDSNIRSLLQQPRHIAILLNSNTLQKGIEDSTHLQLSKMLNQLFIFHTQHSMGNSSGSKDVHTELHLERFKFRSETWFRWQGVSSIPSKSISTCFFVQKGLVVSVMATVFWANFS